MNTRDKRRSIDAAVGLDWKSRPRGETLACYCDSYPVLNYQWAAGRNPLWIRLLYGVFSAPQYLNGDVVRRMAAPLRRARDERRIYRADWMHAARSRADLHARLEKLEAELSAANTRAETLECVALEQLDTMTDEQVKSLRPINAGEIGTIAPPPVTADQVWSALCVIRKMPGWPTASDPPRAEGLFLNKSDMHEAFVLVALGLSTKENL